ncbi:MAG: hypothetical protein WB566_10925, partial [Terriglobales bacterium]
VENFWGRQRVRKARSASLQNHLENLAANDFYQRSDEIAPVRARFQSWLQRLKSTTASTAPGDLNQIVSELGNARSQLASTALGLELLISEVNRIKMEADSAGQISPASEAVLRACACSMDESVVYCLGINLVAKKQSAKAAERAQASQSSTGSTKENESQKPEDEQSRSEKAEEQFAAEECRDLLVCTIESVARRLSQRKQHIEKSQGQASWATAVLLDERTSERFERAEARYHARLYRAMAALQADEKDNDASKILATAYQGESSFSKK